MRYDEQLEILKAKYGPRIIAYLQNVKDLLPDWKYQCGEPQRVVSPDWGSSLDICVGGEDELRILFVVLDSETYDDPHLGVCFALTVETKGGRILDGWDPMLDQAEHWCSLDQPDIIEVKFKKLENIEPQEVIDIIENHM